MTTLREFLLASATGDPDTDALLVTARRNRDAVEVLQREYKRLDQGATWRKQHGKAHLVAKWESDRDAVAAAIESAVVAATMAQDKADQRSRARREREQQVLEITYSTVLADAILESPLVYEDLIIDCRGGYSVYEVQQWTGGYRVFHGDGCTVPAFAGNRYIGKAPEDDCDQCEVVRVKEPRFAYDATVYAPQTDYRSWREADVPTVKGPEINWGSSGSKSIEDSLDQVHVHTVAIGLAQRLEFALDQPLPAAAQALLDGAEEVAA